LVPCLLHVFIIADDSLLIGTSFVWFGARLRFNSM
jgi:hypothetical protein